MPRSAICWFEIYVNGQPALRVFIAALFLCLVVACAPADHDATPAPIQPDPSSFTAAPEGGEGCRAEGADGSPNTDDSPPGPQESEDSGGSNSGPASTTFGPVRCGGSEQVQCTHFPLDAGVISSIRPMGAMSGSHVTPVNHIYITHDSTDLPGHGYVVRMPADRIAVEVGLMLNASRPDCRIVIAHTCRIQSACFWRR